MLLIRKGTVKTMAGPALEDGDVLIGDDGKILEIGKDLAAPQGCEVVEAEGKLVTPGVIEAHCHVGLHNHSLRWEGSDYNDKAESMTPQLRALDAVYPQDLLFDYAIAGGVTTVCTGPGSANVVGGAFAVIKTHGTRADDMAVKSPAAMKIALGENPKNAHGQSKGRAPSTRMAVVAQLRDLMYRSKAYLEDKEAGKNPKFDLKLESMIPVLKKEIPLKAHAHRADDILSAIRVAKEFDVDLTLDHCTEGHIIVQELSKEGYPALVGPTMTHSGKPELKNKSFATAGILNKAGVKVCIITDAPVIPVECLPLCAGLAVSEGLPYEEGWKAITVNPAQVLGVDDRVGTLEKGKDGDLVIWSADPLSTVGAKSLCTVIEGKIVYRA